MTIYTGTGGILLFNTQLLLSFFSICSTAFLCSTFFFLQFRRHVMAKRIKRKVIMRTMFWLFLVVAVGETGGVAWAIQGLVVGNVPTASPVCTFQGFMNQMEITALFLLSIFMSLEMLLKALSETLLRFETPILISIILLSAFISSIPFYAFTSQPFGNIGTECWIPQNSGASHTFLLPMYIGWITMPTMFAIWAWKWKKNEVKYIKRKTRAMGWLPVLITGVYFPFALCHMIATATVPPDALAVIHALFKPSLGILMLILHLCTSSLPREIRAHRKHLSYDPDTGNHSSRRRSQGLSVSTASKSRPISAISDAPIQPYEKRPSTIQIQEPPKRKGSILPGPFTRSRTTSQRLMSVAKRYSRGRLSTAKVEEANKKWMHQSMAADFGPSPLTVAAESDVYASMDFETAGPSARMSMLAFQNSRKSIIPGSMPLKSVVLPPPSPRHSLVPTSPLSPSESPPGSQVDNTRLTSISKHEYPGGLSPRRQPRSSLMKSMQGPELEVVVVEHPDVVKSAMAEEIGYMDPVELDEN